MWEKQKAFLIDSDASCKYGEYANSSGGIKIEADCVNKEEVPKLKMNR